MIEVTEGQFAEEAGTPVIYDIPPTTGRDSLTEMPDVVAVEPEEG